MNATVPLMTLVRRKHTYMEALMPLIQSYKRVQNGGYPAFNSIHTGSYPAFNSIVTTSEINIHKTRVHRLNIT